MKLHFLGTRGYIDVRSAEHSKHSSLAIEYHGRRVIIDCGADWLDQAPSWKADAIVITHAHPDHVDGLKRGAPCPVYATVDTWKIISSFPIHQQRTLVSRKRRTIAGMTFEAFSVEHSLRAPAVGYRVTAGQTTIFYCPDLVYIHDPQAALKGIAAYVGDGATISRSLVRRRGKRLIGHAPIDVQLGWCRKAGVPRAILTHCGTQIVTAHKRALREQLDAWSRVYGLRVDVARDGLEITLRGGPRCASHANFGNQRK